MPLQEKEVKAQGVGGKPTNVPTFAKRKKAMGGGFMARRDHMSRNDFGLRFGEPKQYFGNVPDGRQALANGGRARDKQPPKTKKYFRSTKSGAGMTKAGVARYRRENPGSKLKTAVTGKVKPGSKGCEET